MEHLSNIQQELLQIYSSDIEEKDLLHIKKYLSDYFAEKAPAASDLWEDRSYNFETIKQWLNEDNVRFEL
ncbi:MAG TPA: hypothetical protein VF623_03390 [Segetibacter sp.]|jgi:hypothetical protein